MPLCRRTVVVNFFLILGIHVPNDNHLLAVSIVVFVDVIVVVLSSRSKSADAVVVVDVVAVVVIVSIVTGGQRRH